jgi:mono/diheme cytochrome c family protein
MPMLAKLSQAYPGNAVFQEAIVSSLKGIEDDFKTLISEQDEVINSLLAEAIKNRQEKKINSIFVDIKIPIDGRQNGYLIFRSTCSVCHGADGEGIQYLGPPLNESEYVAGSTDRLGMIILNGVTGPIHVNGKLYKFNNSMPSFGNNFNDQEIVDIITYVRNSFVPAKSTTSYHNVKSIDAERIKSLRDKKMATLTEKELQEMDVQTNK